MLYKGDSVMFNRAYAPPLTGQGRGLAPVRNGVTGHILGINEEGKFALVKLEDKRIIRVRLNENEKNQPIEASYAQSAHKIQGHECEVGMLVPGTDHTATANSAYSQNTRAKAESHVYLDNETHGDDPHKALAESWAQRVDKRMALSWLRREKDKDAAIHEPSAAERQKVAQDREQELREQRNEAMRHRATEQAQEFSEPVHDSPLTVRERLRTAKPKDPDLTTEDQQQPLIRTGGSLRERLNWKRYRDQDRDEHIETPFLRPFKGRDRDDNDRSH